MLLIPKVITITGLKVIILAEELATALGQQDGEKIVRIGFDVCPLDTLGLPAGPRR